MPARRAYGRVRRALRLNRERQQQQQQANNQRAEDKPESSSSTLPGSSSGGSEPTIPAPPSSAAAGGETTESRILLLSDQASSQSGSSSSPSPTEDSVSTTTETLPLDSQDEDEEEMPLRLPRLRLRKSKESLTGSVSEGKAPDATSMASLSSLASNDSWTMQGPEENCGYVVNKLKDLSKLHKAVWKDDLTKVKAALKSLKKPMYVDYFDKENRTALHFACARGQVDIVQAICAAGADTNIADSNGSTPMHKCIESGSSGGLRYLLSHGGNPNLADNLGRTPLHLAAKMGDLSAVALLLEKEARIDVIEKCGLTPLHIATLNGHDALVSALINDGANLDYQDSQGHTCLMMASAEGKTRLVQLYVESKADTSLTDKQGLRALDFAVSRNHHDCAAILEELEKESEKQRKAKPLPLVNNSFLNSVYDIGGPAFNQIADDSPSVSEDLLSPRPGGEDSWGASDTDDDLMESPQQGGVNLKAAFHRKVSEASPESEPVVGPSLTNDKPVDISVTQESKVQPPEPVDLTHYQLHTEDRPSNPEPSDGEESSELTVSSKWDSDDEEDNYMSPFELPDDSPKKLPSVVAVKKPQSSMLASVGSPLNEPPAIVVEGNTSMVAPTDIAGPSIPQPQLLDVGTVSRETSHETMRTCDEEISNFDSEDESLDYVEDVQNSDNDDLGGYVPSTPEKSRTRSTILKRPISSDSVLSEGVPGEGVPSEGVEGDKQICDQSTDGSLFAVTPLSSGHFTSELISPDREEPSLRPITGRPGRSRGVAPVTNDQEDLSDILESDDDEVEQLLNQADNLGATLNENEEGEHEYDESDWDSEESEDEDDEPQVSALMSMSGPSLPDPYRSPPRSPRHKQEVLETPQVPSEVVNPPHDEESESEVNFDPEEDDLGDLLPSDENNEKVTIPPKVESPTPKIEESAKTLPLSPLMTSHRSGSLSPLGSPTLSPLHSSSSLRKLPPLALSRSNRLSPPRLTPIANEQGSSLSPPRLTPIANEQGSSLSPPRLAPIANEQGSSLSPPRLTPIANEQGSSLSPPRLAPIANEQGSSLSPPRLAPIANKLGRSPSPPKLSDHSSIDSETESEWEREKKEKKNLSSSQQFDSGLDTMTTVTGDVTSVAKVTGLPLKESTCVDPPENVTKNGSSSVDPLTDKQTSGGNLDATSPPLTSEPGPSASPSRTPGRLAPLRLPGRGSASLDSVDSPQIQEYKSLWKSGSLFDSSKSKSAPDLPPSKDGPVVATINETTQAPPASGIPAEPSEESILEMLSEFDEEEESDEDDLGADFSGSKLPDLQESLDVSPALVREEPQLVVETSHTSMASQLQLEPTTSADKLSRDSSKQSLKSDRISPNSSEESVQSSTSQQIVAEGSVESMPSHSVDLETTSLSADRLSECNQSHPSTREPMSKAPSLVLQSLPENKPIEMFVTPTRGEPEPDSLVVRSEEEVKSKPTKLTVTSMASTSSGDIKQEITCIDDGTSETSPRPAFESASSLSKVSIDKTTPTLSAKSSSDTKKGVSVSDSRLETKRTDPIDDDLTLESEDSEMSFTPGLSRQPHLPSSLGYHGDTPLTTSQLHGNREDLPQDLSFSDFSSALCTQQSQEMLSQSSKMSDDLPLSRLLQLNQSLRSSQMGGASMHDSAHTAQLHESLREVCHGLERSQDEKQQSHRVRRQLESQLEDCQKKYNCVISSKMSLENVKLDLELQVRELKYQLDQSREGMKSNEGICSQLREQLDRMELRVTKEIESRQAAELKRREIELAHRSLSISHQTIQDELTETSSKLQGEREAKILQEGLYKEQGRMYENLKEESKRAQELKSEFLSKLELSDSTRHSLQEHLSELIKVNTQLDSQLASEKKQLEEVEGQLELVKSQLRDRTERHSNVEDSLVETQHQFEGHLNELKEKAEFLSVTLDKEASQRSQAEAEVASLQSKLDSMTIELQTVVRQTGEKQDVLSQQLDELRQEKSLREKDLELTRELHSQQITRSEALETKLQTAENELKSSNALLFERANQIAALQRDVDHNQSRVTTLEEAIHSERDRQSKMEVQLTVANEKAASLRSEGVALGQQLEFTQRRVEEKELNVQQVQGRFDGLLGTLRTEYEKSKESLEQKCQSLIDAQASLREEAVRREAEISALEKERESLKKQVTDLHAGQSELSESLQATEDAYRELDNEKNEVLQTAEDMQEKITELSSALTAQLHQTSLLEEKVAGCQASLSEAHDTTRVALADKESALEQKALIEAQLQEALKNGCGLEMELEAGQNREKALEKKIEHLNEVRSTMQTRLSEQQAEVHQALSELEQMTAAHAKAANEAEEARGLWESEVRSKSKLGMKIMELEKTHASAGSLVDVEKRRTRKALEMKKGAEWKLEALQNQHVKLTSELASSRTQLKLSKRRMQELELGQSQIPDLRAEYDREQSSLRNEIEGLKQLVSSTQAHFKREVEKRHRAEQTTSRVRQELEEAKTHITLGHSESQSRRKDTLKVERTNKKLREELATLQEHMNIFMVSRTEMDAYKKAVEEKAHRELSRKLEEVNLHLEQQSQAQEALTRLRLDTEAEQREKFDRSTTEMRLQLGQSESDRHTAVTEARRYKELYETELMKTSNLTSHLQRAKEDSCDYQNKLSHERNRTQQLLNATQTAVGQFTPPKTRPPLTSAHVYTTSTPRGRTPPQATLDLSPTDSLLNSVRAQLDHSIARHRDRVPTTKDTIGTATRSTYSPHKTSLNNISSKYSHLDAIKRNYRI